MSKSQSYPKWKYRKHPKDGYFQQTLVASAAAEAELDADWSDDPATTGFEVRPATQMHSSHFTAGAPLHEVVTEVVAGKNGKPTLKAKIKVILKGDKTHA